MSRERISQGRGFLSAVAIIAYFAVFTAWLPSLVLRSSLLATAPDSVANVIILGIWVGFFGFGLFALRWSQDRELI